MYEAVWDCRTCGNGQIALVTRDDSGDLLGICEECTQTYVDVDADGRVATGGLGYDIAVSYATGSEIAAHGWAGYVRRWVEPDE